METNQIQGRTANLANAIAKEVLIKLGAMPKTALILGSGLANAIETSKSFKIKAELNLKSLSFQDLPKFEAEGHKLRIIIVEEKTTGESVIVVCGRKHIYEIDWDHSLNEVVRIPRALALAGVTNFIHTSAVGGILASKPGQLIWVTDHDGLELLPRGLFTGSKSSKFGPTFFDCSSLYKKMETTFYKESGCVPGILQWHSGPNFETPAQVKRLMENGISGVGMSMIPEVMALHQLKLNSSGLYKNIENIGIAVVSNSAAGIKKEEINHTMVQKTMQKASKSLIKLVVEIIKKEHFDYLTS